MTKLQEFLFGLTFYELQLIRQYMRRRYKVSSVSLRELEQGITDYIPDEEVFEELHEVIS